MNKPQLPALITTDIVDADAIAIGELYESGNSSIVDAVLEHLACGALLTEKKATMAHGEWEGWLTYNAVTLRFGSRTAQKWMRANDALAHHLGEGEATANTPPVADLNCRSGPTI